MRNNSDSEIDFACRILGKTPDEIAKGNIEEIRPLIAIALRFKGPLRRKRGSIPFIIKCITLLNAFWIRNGRQIKDPYGGIPEDLRRDIETYYKKKRRLRT